MYTIAVLMHNWVLQFEKLISLKMYKRLEHVGMI